MCLKNCPICLLVNGNEYLFRSSIILILSNSHRKSSAWEHMCISIRNRQVHPATSSKCDETFRVCRALFADRSLCSKRFLNLTVSSLIYSWNTFTSFSHFLRFFCRKKISNGVEKLMKRHHPSVKSVIQWHILIPGEKLHQNLQEFKIFLLGFL